MADNARAVRLRVGKKVRQLRRMRGFSQEQLAERAGNTHRHIGQIERGQVNVTIDILTAVATGLSVDVAELFGSPDPSGQRTYTIGQREFDQLEQGLRIVDRLKRTGA
jgi:transcriptional regulator with XRE-family HTH domain